MPIVRDWPATRQAFFVTMVNMFAPYCPTCRARVLLGPRRIVAAQLERRPMSIHVACFCGTVVAADNPEPPVLTVIATTKGAAVETDQVA